ncbi:MAG: hypothetical protein L3J41_15370 [Melioribacteraceae bacterium]|nr:hypothetical protein [Melioribacteraceae bacterium]
MISKKEISKKINSAFWDYNIDPNDIYLIVLGKKEGTGFFTVEKILIRLLERLSWYEIVDLFGKEFLTKNLSPSIIKEIRNPEIRNRYEFIRRILQRETLSHTGWGFENRKRLKSSVLSHRWNGA